MSERLDYLEAKLEAKLEELNGHYEAVKRELRRDVGVIRRRELEETSTQLQEDIGQVNHEINKLQKRRRQEEKLALDNKLVVILERKHINQSKIQQAYRTTLDHWPVPVNRNADTAHEILTELKKIVRPVQNSYNALEEFIAHLVSISDDRALIESLQEWGEQYRQGIDWLNILEQVQEQQKEKEEYLQPALLILIRQVEQRTTQSQEAYYQVEAWLIEDIETYKRFRRGVHRLMFEETLESDPCSLEDLEHHLMPHMKRFLAEDLNRMCPECLNFPEIHVFLPQNLMYLDIDVWLLNEQDEQSATSEVLGHDYVVVLRCDERYRPSYRKQKHWKSIWKNRYRYCQQVKANQVFVEGCDSDLLGLARKLRREFPVMQTFSPSEQQTVQENQKIGVQLTQAPCNSDSSELLSELLQNGVPLAIWMRSDLMVTRRKTRTHLNELLKMNALAHLPKTVRHKREESFEHEPERHIGHHLSLLWDDPEFVLPNPTDLPKKPA